ncbi:Uncharacterized protein TCAP_02445 [Tolypocladium capitatum]|uniref:Transcription factor domain-containing protein n=1 Tax=Tolypocladium capitatum TaxID=45235 RepID=A0A2K3QJC2_9HYPO|nr:Uncharacterized protein TCAP_02445 [Tolypocladium capitatum]
MLSRLERLEALVASQARAAAPEPPRQVAYPEPSQPVASRLQRLTADVLWLEKSCTGQKLLDSLVADPITFRTCPIHLITKPSSFVIEPDASAGSLRADGVIKCIWLPRREEAHCLLQKYASDVSHFHHIVHVPSLPGIIDAVYNGLDQGNGVDLGALVLLLSICTSTTYGWTAHDDARGLYVNAAEANSHTTAWLKAALDVVDYAQRTAHVSLECTQGMIILFVVVCCLEGVSSRARSLIAQSIAMGRELALHCIDYPDNSAASVPAQSNTVKTEIGRRVWWYLAASDWMLSQFSAPQEGTYTILPSRMVVRKPRNTNDDDIVDGREVVDRPLDEPTSVSYLLQRIRLAEVYQELLDRSPFILLSPEAMEYQQVMEVDARLRQFLQDIPSFFSLDNMDLHSLPSTDPRRSPSITVQRYALNILLHRQLCKLHLPYLARGTVEPAFAYSHESCLRSARLIIHVEHQLRREDLPFVSFRQRMNLTLRSVFVACIALVLHACLGNDSQDSVASGKELSDAWSILQEATDQCPLASKLLELSIQVLKKNKAAHPALEALEKPRPHPHGGTPPMTPDSGHRDESRNGAMAQQLTPKSETAFLEQQWQVLQGGTGLDAIDWDKFFWGLDAPFM